MFADLVFIQLSVQHLAGRACMALDYIFLGIAAVGNVMVNADGLGRMIKSGFKIA